MRHHFAVVLPAYNEAVGLETLLWRITRALHGHDYEIIVVDDGSTDDTAAIAESLSSKIPVHLVRHGVNQGYGAAIRTGILEGRERAEIVVTMDADDSHDPALIPLMLHGIACGSDIIVASRFVPGGREVGVPLHRKVLSHGARVVFKTLLRLGDVGDYTSGYRAYRSDFIDEMIEAYGLAELVEEMGFTVGVELLCKAAQIEGRLAEVPLILRYDRKRSASKLKIGKTLREYVELIRRVRESGAERPVASREERRRRHPVAEDAAMIVLFDVLGVFAAFVISFLLYRSLIRMDVLGSEVPDPTWYASIAGLFALSTLFTFWQFGLYMPRLSVLHLRHLQHVAQALTVSIAVFFASLFLLAMDRPSRFVVLGAIVLVYPIVLLLRGAVMGWLRTRRLRASRVNRVLIYGAGKTGMLLAKKIKEAPMLRSQDYG
jgi:dolichol-phosphate mannosyltransferase